MKMKVSLHINETTRRYEATKIMNSAAKGSTDTATDLINDPENTKTY